MALRKIPSMLRVPAIQALLIQILSFFAMLLLIRGAGMLGGVTVTLLSAALIQGSIAAVFSRWRGLAPWWLPIQFLFPVALIMVHALQIPPWFFLGAFLLLLGLYWTTFRTQVPLYVSGPAVWESVASLLPAGRPLCFIDIGSGLGGLILHLAERRAESIFTGIEVAPLPWLASLLRARMGRSQARFVRGDYSHLDFARYDVVFAYLSPAAMPGLWRKACAEMRPGTLLLSYEFVIPEIAPDIVIAPKPGGASLHGWRIQ